MTRPLVVIDFDGTLTTVDVGDALCERFADPSWIDIDHAWVRGEVSLPEAQRRMWAMMRASREELVRWSIEVGTLRRGADALFDAAKRGAIELVLASGGFDVYIDAILGEQKSAFSAMHCSTLEFGGEGITPIFDDRYTCPKCAVCKAEVVRHHQRDGRDVVFCGDGSSDRCAAGIAGRTFVIRGSLLDRHCEAEGKPRIAIDDFHELLAAIGNA